MDDWISKHFSPNEDVEGHPDHDPKEEYKLKLRRQPTNNDIDTSLPPNRRQKNFMYEFMLQNEYQDEAFLAETDENAPYVDPYG